MTNGFTRISNSIILDYNLSVEAIGLYNVIQYFSSIPNFKINREHIKEVSRLKEHSFRKVWKELKDAGVLLDNKSHQAGRISYNYELIKTNIEDIPAVEETTEEIEEIKTQTNFTTKQAKKISKIADIKTIIKYFKYVQAKGEEVGNVFAYTLSMIKRKINISPAGQKKVIKGVWNNYEQRQYTTEQFESMERKLLGWDF